MKKIMCIPLMLIMHGAIGLELTSPDIATGELLSIKHVHNGFGCEGESLSPELHWADVPAGTKSFAITVFDPDANSDSGWWHWLIVNIPKELRSIPQAAGNGAAPKGSLQTITDIAAPGFHGACPGKGSGIHQYRFTLHALNVESLALEAGEKTMPAEVSYTINSHTIEKALITVPYQR